MSTASPLADSFRGYLSEASKRRFTLVAGIFGALFFIAQFALPMIVVFALILPMTFGVMSTADVDSASVWRGDLWYVERAVKVNWRDPTQRPATTLSLRRVRLSDLESSGPALPLPGASAESSPSLLPVGDRLWLIGGETVSYFDGAAVRRLGRAKQPSRASRPFSFGGRPAVLSLGRQSALAVLTDDGTHAEWTATPVALGQLAEGQSLHSVQAIERAGELYVFGEFCGEDEDTPCSLQYRALTGERWLPLVSEICRCGDWTAVAAGEHLAVVLPRSANGPASELTVLTVGPEGSTSRRIQEEKGRAVWHRSRPVSVAGRLVFLSAGMPGSLSLSEVSDGKLVRIVEKKGSFPFSPNMMLLMLVPQLLPMLLSLVLALLLTVEMRRHRVQEYAVGDSRRVFASLWQRALAQLVDAVPLAAGFALPIVFMWRTMSDPESLAERGLLFPLVFLGLFAAAFACALLVLVIYSYFEGRSGKTPGKWLLRIRVLGTDLQPCGFGRALLRNVLTVVDGFFNFLVGALLVALTENWQRLGDLAARTVVVSDQPS
jgi:uncharacterized RDD family membrane protein YckC